MDESAGRKIYAFNKEMEAAGVMKLACGLGAAKSLRAQTDGKVLITDGPYLETKEQSSCPYWNAAIDDVVKAGQGPPESASRGSRGAKNLVSCRFPTDPFDE